MVLLTNTDQKQAENFSVLFRLIDQALGLSFDQSVSEHVKDLVTATRTPPPPHEVHVPNLSPDLDIDLDALAGTYTSSTYGTLTLCAPLSASASCTSVLDDFALVPFSAPFNASLYAMFSRVWASHLRLTRAAPLGLSFRATFPRLFPHGFGRNATPLEYADPEMSVGQVEFVLEGGEVVGFALVTDVVAAAARTRRGTSSAREMADAWFARVEDATV